MDPVLLREYEAKLVYWLSQGYKLLADDIDGELRITAHFVSRNGEVGSEREQEYWPMTPAIRCRTRCCAASIRRVRPSR